MKRLISLVFALCFIPAVSLASAPDLSSLTFDELVSLREQLNIAIWNCQEWKEVTVPEGTWIVGIDIPAGHWTIRPAHFDYFYISVFDKADEIGKGPGKSSYYWSSELLSPGYPMPLDSVCPSEVDVILKDGWYFRAGGDVVFSPYTGHPDFGFN